MLGDLALNQSLVVDYGRDGNGHRCKHLQREVLRTAGHTFVACRIHRCCRPPIGVGPQRTLRREAPSAIGRDRRRAHQIGAVVHPHPDRPRRCHSAEGGGRIVGGVALQYRSDHRTKIVGQCQARWCTGRRGIDREHQCGARGAAVAGWIGLCDAQAVRAFAQGAGGHTPSAIAADDRAAHAGGAIEHLDQGAWLTTTATQGGPGVVGERAVVQRTGEQANIVVDGECRHTWRMCIDGDAVGVAGCAHIASGVADAHGVAGRVAVAVRQALRHIKTPVGAIDRGVAQIGRAVIDPQRLARGQRLAERAAQCGPGVVAHTTMGHCASDDTHVVADRGQGGRGRRRHGVNEHWDGRTARAGVARRVTPGVRQRVWPIGKRCIGRQHAGVGVVGGRHRHTVHQVHRSDAGRQHSNVERRPRVVGVGARAQVARDKTHIVHRLCLGRRRWRLCVDGEGDGSGRIALIALRVGGGQAQRVCAFAQSRRRWRQAPRPAGTHHHTGDRRAVVVERDGVARRGPCAREGRGAVIGHVTAGERALQHTHVVGDAAQSGHRWRCCVNGQRKCGVAAVAATHRRGGVGVRAWRLAGQGHLPEPTHIGHRTAQRGATFGDGHQRPWRGTAHQCGCGVVGAPTIGHLAGDARRIVERMVDLHPRVAGVDRDVDRRAGLAFVARRVGGAQGDGVRALAQRLGGRHAPVAAAIDHRAGDGPPVVIHGHHIARCAPRAAEGRGGVVGGLSSGDGAGLGALVVGDGGRRRCAGCTGVNDHRVAAGGRTGHTGQGGHRREGLGAAAQGGTGRDAPTARGVDRGTAHLNTVGAEHHGAAGHARAADRRCGVVGALPFLQQTREVGLVVAHACDARHGGRVAAQLKHQVRPGAAHVAGLVHRRGADDVRAIGQRGFGGEAPRAGLRVHRGGAQQHPVVVDAHGLRTLRRHATEGGAAVVGHAVVRDGALRGVDVVVRTHTLQRRLGCGGVHRDAHGRTGRTLIARRIGGGECQAVFALGQARRRRCQAPRPTGAHHHTGQGCAVGVQGDDVARRRTAATEGGGGVVGDVAITQRPLQQSDVIGDGAQGGRVGRCCVDGQRKGGAGGRATVEPGLAGAVAVRAFALCGCWREAPDAVAAHRGRSQHLGAFAEGHHRSGAACAHQGGCAVVGAASVGHMALHRVAVVFCPGDGHWLSAAVHRQCQGGRHAGVARRVLRHHAQGVWALRQRHRRRHAPLTTAIDQRAAQQHVAAAHHHHVPRLRPCASHRRRRVVRRRPRRHRPHLPTHVVPHLKHHQPRCSLVNGKDPLAGAGPCLAFGVDAADRHPMLAFAQRWQGVAPLTVGVDQHTGSLFTIEPHHHPRSGLTGAAQCGLCVVGGVKGLQGALARAHVVLDITQHHHWRGSV